MWFTMSHVNLHLTVVVIVDGDGESSLTLVLVHSSTCPPLGGFFMKVVFALFTIKLSTVVIDNSEIIPVIFSFLTVIIS